MVNSKFFSLHPLGDPVERHVMIPGGSVEEKEVTEARVVRPVFGGDRLPFLAVLLLDHDGQGEGVSGGGIMQERTTASHQALARTVVPSFARASP